MVITLNQREDVDAKFHPLPAQIAARVAVNGGQADLAAHHLAAEFKVRLQQLQLASPKVGKAIETDLDNAMRLREKAIEHLASQDGLISEIEQALRVRADLLACVNTLRREHAAAVGMLNNPDALQLVPGELLQLDVQRRHQPAQTDELVAQAATLTNRIQELAKSGSVDLPVLVRWIYQNAGVDETGHIREPHVRTLIDAGLFELSPA